MRTPAAAGVSASPALIEDRSRAWKSLYAVISASNAAGTVRSSGASDGESNRAKDCMASTLRVVSGTLCSTLYCCDERRSPNPTECFQQTARALPFTSPQRHDVILFTHA